MVKLYLDDKRTPENPEEWVIVRSYKEFVDYIQQNGIPDFISFDHDLADFMYENEKTGYDCAKFVEQYVLEQTAHGKRYEFIDYACHSMNPGGKLNIERCMHQLNLTIGRIK